MAESRARAFAKLAKDVDTSGNIVAKGISSDVTLGGATIYASRASLPTSGNTAGDQAYVTGNNRLYIWNGSGWYNVALLNVAPSIQSVLDSDGGTTPFSLAVDGTPTTITITALDSDGDPITYEAAADSDFAGLGTISQADNVFTITPFSSDSATTETGTITFTATDGVNVASSGVQTFRLFFVSALWDETVLSIGTNSANGLDNSTFVDRSSNAYTVTPTGSPVQTAFHPYLDNWSSEFSGSEWIQTVSTNSAFDFSAGGDFTIEMWVKDNLTTDGVRTIMNMKSGSYGFLFRRHSSNRWELYYNGSNRTYLYIADYGSLTDWYHMAITLQSGQLRWFVNGQEGFTTSSITQSNYNFTTLDLGSYSNGNWNGYISNVRVVKGTALYTSNFTPPTEKLTAVSGTTFLAHQSNRFIDNGGNNEPITISAGTLKVSAYNPFGQGYEYAVGQNKGSTYVASSGSYLRATSIYALGSGNFTIESWIYPTSLPNAENAIFSHGTADNVNSSTCVLFVKSNATLSFYNYPTSISSTETIKLNQWNHVACVRSGTTINLYVNGIQSGSGSYSSNISNTTASILQGYGGIANPFLGYISDVYSSAGTAKYTSDFTPPTAPVGNTNASLYLPMDNAGIFDKTGNSTLLPNGSTATSTTQTKYASSSINFPKNSTLSVLYEAWMALSDQDFTMEMWVYPTDSSGGTLWSFGYNADNRLDFGWQGSGGIRLLIETSNVSETVFTSSDAVSTYLNSWVHIAVVRSGTTFTLYINGASTATGTSSLSIVEDTTDGWTFGGREFSADYLGETPNDPFAGYLENIQLIKVAKYTANFTPPTGTQGRQYQAIS